MPDFDVDFHDRRRQEVIDYVVAKYGADCVSQIGTFSFLKARSAIRDVGRVLGIPIPEVDRIAKMMTDLDIGKAVDQNPELKAACEDNPTCRELVETARMLEGIPRQSGVHAAGVVIADVPIAESIPVLLNKEGGITTQFPMDQIDALGFMKMDFLGLRTLTVIQETVDRVEKREGIKIDIGRLDYNDSKVYEMIGEGKTEGVFQLESAGMTRFMKDLKPGNLEDIIAGISLFRPGPMDQIPKYLEGKRDPGSIRYPHPLLEPILNVTYGCLVYQEQVMQTVRDLAGYSMGRSDLVRKAMSKKQAAVMEKEREHFVHGIIRADGSIEVEGAVRRGVPEDVANHLFDAMMDFASYAFNKAHAAAYAVVAYRTAWLRVHYPRELMAATLNSNVSDNAKIAFYIQACRDMGMEVLPPDINESSKGFTVTNKGIRFGMMAVKGSGEAAVEAILRIREEGGPFLDFPDFCYRTAGLGVNRKCVENLIRCGAFSSFSIYRSRMLAVLDTLMDSISAARDRISANQMSLLDLEGGESAGYLRRASDVNFPSMDEYPPDMLCSFEKDLLGIYVTGHPVSRYAEILARSTNLNSRDVAEWAAAHVRGGSEEDMEGFDRGEEAAGYTGSSLSSEGTAVSARELRDGMEIFAGGMISSRKNRTTKSGRMMATFLLEDLYGQLEVMVFPGVYDRLSPSVQQGSVALVRGRLLVRLDEVPKIACEEILPVMEKKPECLRLQLPAGMKDGAMGWILPYLKYFNGNTPVTVATSEGSEEMRLGGEFAVDLSAPFVLEELAQRIRQAGGSITLDG
ncbi:MAG TPA: hypothetical protein DD727_06375 [Clostridiales bacterium]|nr:hypothetical protein [Clostridiales bacterium]